MSCDPGFKVLSRFLKEFFFLVFFFPKVTHFFNTFPFYTSYLFFLSK